MLCSNNHHRETLMNTDIVEHYSKLALNDSWIDYVRQRVKELEQDSSGMWIGLGKAIAKRMKELQ
jgi:hypothetical protein